MPHPPCCRAGLEQGYCTVYGQLMPANLLPICQGVALTPEECAAYRERWTREGGPLKLKIALPAAPAPIQGFYEPPPSPRGDCTHLGAWTGRVCATCPVKLKIFSCLCEERNEQEGTTDTHWKNCGSCAYFQKQT